MSKAIKWARRYGSLDADVYDTLDEAITAAVYAEDTGDETLDCIEHEGERITAAHPSYSAVAERIEAEDKRLREDRRPATHSVEVRHPDGQWVTLYRVTMPLSDSTADEMREFASVLGEDRIRFVARRSQS